MKQSLNEALLTFKRLTTEATTTASSGAYEVPMAFEKEEPCGYQDETGLVGSEVMLDAPEVDIVDITDVYDDGDEYQEDEEIVLDLTDDIFNNLDMFTETTKQTPIIKQKI